jgi:hypothetical protein
METLRALSHACPTKLDRTPPERRVYRASNRFGEPIRRCRHRGMITLNGVPVVSAEFPTHMQVKGIARHQDPSRELNV